jgi:hypothetical protein
MTTRLLGETAIKIVGVHYAAATVVGFASAMSSLMLPAIEGLPPVGQLMLANLFGVAALGLVAGVCLLRAEWIAQWLFQHDRAIAVKPSAREALFVGIALIGLAWAASGVPEILKAAGTALWYVEGGRRPLLSGGMSESSEAITNAALAMIVGVAIRCRPDGCSAI